MTERLTTRYESDTASPGFMLWRVTNRWQAAMRATLAPFNLTHVQFVLLASLTWMADPIGTTQTDLSQMARADPMMVSQVLRVLETKGLVERRADPNDGRARRVSITDAGRAAAQAANQAVEATDGAFFGTDSGRPLPLIEHLSRLDERG